MTSLQLPPLAFGNSDAIAEHSIAAVYEQISRVMGSGNWDMASVGSQPFEQMTRAVRLGNLNMVAVSCTPTQVKWDTQDAVSLRLPIAGTCQYLVDGKKLLQAPAQNAVLLSGARRESETSPDYSGVFIPINPGQLAHVSHSMLANERVTQALIQSLGVDREVPLNFAGIDFSRLLSQKFKMLEMLGCDQEHALKMFGLEDQMYRLMVTLLAPEYFLTPSTASHASHNRHLNRVCDYCLAHLDEPISLTDMENVAGLNRRSLQQAFLRQFGLSPTIWLRQQRLRRVHERLCNPLPGENITAIALSYGFVHLSAFAAYYKEQYGELPSATLSRGLERFA